MFVFEIIGFVVVIIMIVIFIGRFIREEKVMRKE